MAIGIIQCNNYRTNSIIDNKNFLFLNNIIIIFKKLKN